ncbi:TonB-dependent receptor plug domain-containing protein [Sphingomonas psychrotolerans]|uniref:TonB-dependent receptor n=1 Tax=Sphingomonas psychrotolerans TaxID=1327635 RepID=A0A2K8MJK1_9SPHN|nr:TonB-dependent receptor [Sphingomonas psychrotolerans]ATY34058.1 TonB-dependent receptor [Sphingomonas psychrotolerans]
MTKLKLFLYASAALLPAVAHAQSDEDQIVVVASGVEQEAETTGRSITVLDRAAIETRQTVSLSDLLATTPGITATRNGGPGGVTAVRIRGAEDAQTLVLIDGVRANDPSAPAGAFDFGNLLTGSIQRVEILRGPNSVIWGSQALGGVVNLVTQAPVDGVAARANAEYGYAEQVSANAAIAAGNDTLQGALTGGYFRTDGVSQAAVGTEADGYRQYNASGRLRYEFAPGFGVDLRGYYANSRLELDGFAPPTYSFGDTDEYSTAQELYGYAGLFADIGPVANRIAFTIADINRDGYNSTSDTAPAYLYRGRSERYEYRGDAKLVDQLRVTFGAERENLRFYDGFVTNRADITSFYGQAIVTPVEQVTLTAGIRNDDHSRFGAHTSWGANLAVKPFETTLLRASYGEGFKAPTLYQLFSDYGTESLDPETAKSWEVGVEQSALNGAAKLGVTWFHRDTRNQIDFFSCPAAQVTNPASICFNRPFGTYANIARTRAEGVEVELALKPVEAFTVTANYTYTDAENRSAGYEGNQLARRPQDTASLSADYRLPFGLSLGGTVTIVGDSFNDQGNFTRLDGFALGSIRAEMPIGDRFAVYGRVENVTDEKYQVVSGYGTYGRAAYAGVRIRLN